MIQWLRDHGLPVPPGNQGGTLRLAYSGLSFGDAAFASVRTLAKGGAAEFHASARTSSSTPVGGTFGVAYPAIRPSAAALSEAWVFGLKQDGSARSNLALTNTVPPPSGSPPTPSPVELSVEFFDGDTGLSAGFQTVSVDAFYPRWIQLNSPLTARGIRTGYVRVRAPAGNVVPFIVYGVVNDGASPGQGTGDGSYLGMSGVK